MTERKEVENQMALVGKRCDENDGKLKAAGAEVEGGLGGPRSSPTSLPRWRLRMELSWGKQESW